MNDYRQACVSYAWKEELSHEPARAGKVEEFCTKLKAAGLRILRDTKDLKFGEQISAFMRRIGSGERVYVFLSDAYLKSPNCMYELLTIWRTSGGDDEQFSRRVWAYKMPELGDLSRATVRSTYFKYWERERAKLEKLTKSVPLRSTSVETLTEFQNVCEFADLVDRMLAKVADILRPIDLDTFIAHAIDERH